MKAKPKKRKLNLDEVLTRIVQLLLVVPPAGVTFSKVSKASGVPRATLYYYFGNNRAAMIEEAVRFGMKSFVQIGTLSKDKPFPDWESFQRARFLVSTRFFRDYPWAPGLYFRFRNDPGRLGEIVREIEGEYLRSIGRVWQRYHKTAPDPRALQLSGVLKIGFLWGLSCQPETWFGEKGWLVTKKDKRIFQKAVDFMTRVSTEAMKLSFE